MSAHPLFTIGHSNHPLERFLELLREHGVQAVTDVRSTPASRRNPQYNRDALKSSLAGGGIEYRFLGKELGARRAEREAYEGNVARYELIARLPAFREGLGRVEEGAASRRVALMCAEKDPLDCHRALLVCRHLRDAIPGEILHILADGTIETHTQAERRLVLDMGTEAAQPDLFAGGPDFPLEQAYRARGLAIAYRKE